MAKGKAGGSADHAAVTREQNRLRGIIGSISDRRATEIEPTKAFREHIRLSLLESRRRLKPAQLEQLVTWLTLQRVTGVRDTAAAILLGPSSVIGRSKESSVSTELRWLLARLLPEVERLRSFRSMAEDLNRLAWAGDLNGSLQLLDNIDSRFGSTLWSIELRLAFVAMKDGLEAQKQYLRQLREEWGGGMPGFLAFYYSIRNEDRSTIRLFRDDVRKRVDKFRLFPQAKTYLRFRLADEFSGERRDISRILSCEQTQSILDVYETTVEVIQRLIKMGKHKRYASAVVHWAKGLEAVGDFRLSKILFALGEEPNVNLPRRSGSAAGLLAQGEVDRAYQQATSEHHLQPSNVYAAVESLVAAGVEKQTAEPGATLWRSLYPTLSSILLADGDFEVSVGSIEKFTRNFRGLHSAVALADVAAFLAGGAERFESALGAGALNSEWVGPEDVLLASGSSAQQLELGFGFSDYAAARGASRNSQIAVLASSFVSYFEALRTATTTPRRAFESLRKVALGFIPTALRRLILITRIDLALSENERNLAIEDIADLAALHPASRTILPVERVLANRSWHDLASSGPRLDLAVALDVVWQKTGDDQFGSFLRFAFEDVLAERQVTHPHQLLNGESQPDHKLIYFLRYIASPQVMDLTGLFATSRSVLEERIAVCESLSAADPINQKAYDEEAYTLKSQLLVQDGLRIVDTSRINVDTVAISRWAERRYAESFSRYKALVAAGIGIASDLTELVRRANANPNLSGDFFSVPENEADELLLEISIAIRDRFLNDPDHGLECFLGKRIRHGTITGHLRGPVENTHLITQRESEAADYNANSYWLDQLAFDGGNKRDDLDRAFKDFARSYDEIARSLKDDWLHVRTRQHPRGLFTIVISPAVFQVLRSSAQDCDTFAEFLSLCYTLFWILLRSAQDEAKKLFSFQSKEQAVKLFDELQSSARNDALHDDAYQALTLAIRNTAAEVHRQLDSMTEWLTRAEGEQATLVFELAQAVNIAVQSALNSQTGFTPKITFDIEDSVEVPPPTLVWLSEIFSVIINNACSKSQSGVHPTIAIKCGLNEDRDVLLIEVVNSLGKSLDAVAIEAKLTVIRNRIAAGDIQRGASVEGGSGLLKVAQLTQRASKSYLEFGITANGRFRTMVALEIQTTDGSVALVQVS